MFIYVLKTECIVVFFVVGFGEECLTFFCCATYKILHTGDTNTPIQKKNNVKKCHLSGVTCQVSHVWCQVSGVACHVSRVTCQMSLEPIATVIDPPSVKGTVT